MISSFRLCRASIFLFAAGFAARAIADSARYRARRDTHQTTNDSPQPQVRFTLGLSR
jgi:hypothetical protein